MLLAALAAGCSGDDDATDASTDVGPSTTTASSTSSTTEKPLAGKPLVVVDKGVATWPDPFDPLATLGGYGVILENPDRGLVATGVRVITRILDADGTELLRDSALLNGILPGTRMAVGRTLIEPIESPTQLDVAIEVAAWLEPASSEGAFTATDVVTEPEEAGGAVTRFNVQSTWPASEEGVDATAVYRAADGRILAAEQTSIGTPVTPGEPATGSVRLLSPIPDLASTEVFVGRGFAAQTSG